MKSIRQYLLRSLLIAMFGISILIGVFIYFNAAEDVDELYDKNMQELAYSMQGQLPNFRAPDTNGRYAIDKTRQKLRGEEEFLIQLWRHGKLYYSSHPAIEFPLQDIGEKKHHGVYVSEFNQRKWAVYQLSNEHGVVQVSQPSRARSHFINEIASRMLIPILVQIPLLGFFIWFAVGKSLRPLEAISEGIKRRTAASMEALPLDDTPLEIRPLVQELNELLVRLSAALEAQRRFVADAAHELRTPLTALQLQLGVLDRAKTAEERKLLTRKLQNGIERASHMVRQLLTLARLEPEATARPYQRVALLAVAREVAEAYTGLAVKRHIDLSFPRIEEVEIEGDYEALRILLNNLVDNALRFTPEGGHVDISLYREGPLAILEVEDTGIGIPESQRAHIFERFYRVLGTDVDGTGLGLAIVKNIVEQHAGVIGVEDGRAGGTRFRIAFTAAA